MVVLGGRSHIMVCIRGGGRSHIMVCIRGGEVTHNGMY